MSDQPLKTLSDIATEAHTRIQQTFADINPVVGVRRGMRDNGIPADAMTIDCLSTRKRIVLILHDEHPGQLLYQFSELDQDTEDGFQQMAFDQMNVDTLFEWMKTSFKP